MMPYGFFKRVVAVSQNAQKILDDTADYRAAVTGRAYRIIQRSGFGFY